MSGHVNYLVVGSTFESASFKELARFNSLTGIYNYII